MEISEAVNAFPRGGGGVPSPSPLMPRVRLGRQGALGSGGCRAGALAPACPRLPAGAGADDLRVGRALAAGARRAEGGAPGRRPFRPLQPSTVPGEFRCPHRPHRPR